MTTAEPFERERYLRKAMEENPDYAGILPLYIAITEHVTEHGDATGASFRLRDDAEERIGHGKPAITAEDLIVNGKAVRAFMLGLAERLISLAIGETGQLRNIGHIPEAEFPKLLAASFKGQRGPIQSAAFRLRINPGVLESLLSVPVKQAAMAAAANVSAEWYGGWKESTCPVCGSEPSMGRRDNDTRSLSCGVCTTSWQFHRQACALCGNDEAEKLSHIMIEGDCVRIEVCCTCGRYLKTEDASAAAVLVPLDLLDVTTMHLDIIAQRHGFTRV